MTEPSQSRPHALSVVIPVYQGVETLRGVIGEILPFTEGFTTADGHEARIAEVVLVYDRGPDDSAQVMRTLAQEFSFIKNVWLSRNFGQHPTTLAGMASTGGDWIVTMDEDGQHDPAAIPRMLDVAMAEQADLVYARPVTALPHSFTRNLSSRIAKRIIAMSAGSKTAREFNSFRLVLGEVGRSVAAYAGAGAYLDVAMTWVAGRITTCPVELRPDSARPSGYNYRSLFSHFWRMAVSSGTRALRMVSLTGAFFAVLGVGLAVYLFIAKVVFSVDLPSGWPSLMVALLLSSGAILFSLGVIAEYIGVSVNMAMGRPLYLIVSDPAHGPLGRQPRPVGPPPGVRDPGDTNPGGTNPGGANPGDTDSGVATSDGRPDLHRIGR